MAMSVTATETTHTAIKKIKFAWTSAAAGTASGSTTAYFDGEVVGLATVPDGVAAPTADYDITVTDSDTLDVLIGAGANRHTTNTEYVAAASLAAVSGSKLTLNISNAGDTKKGTVYLWID